MSEQENRMLAKMAGILVAAAILAGLLAGCGGGGGGGSQDCATLDPLRNTNLPSCGNAASAKALFTTAPNAVTIPLGATATYTIGGGSAPYTASSSNIKIVSTGVDNATLTINGIAEGTTQVTVMDSVGKSVSISLTVGTSAALFTTAPSALTLPSGTTAVYAIGGGTAPYIANSSNTAIVTASVAGTTLTINSVAQGTAQIAVVDAAGKLVTITVSTSVPAALFTTAPSSVTLAVGGTAAYTIGGGTAPYTATSSNLKIATTGVSGTGLTLNGLTEGTTQILVVDSVGKSVSISLTVGTAVALFTSAPAAVTIPAGTTATYTIGGGTAPYMATSSNAAVVTASVAGSTLTIRSIAPGTAQIALLDSAGKAVTINVITSVAGDLFTTAPGAVTIAVGATLTYTIGGGNAPYSATSSNASTLTASVSGSTLTLHSMAPGTVQVIVQDSAGKTVAISASTSAATALFTTAPAAVTIVAGEQVSYTIGGGSAPYTASSSNAKVMSAAVSGTTLTLNGLSDGTSQVVVIDSVGKSVSINFTIGSSVALFTTAPPAVTILSGETANYAIGGGSLPYSATSSNTAVVTASAGGGTLAINGIAQGTAQIALLDAGGKLVTISVTVQSRSSGIPPSIFPASITTSDCTTNIPFLITGGSAPFTILTSDYLGAPVTAALRLGTNYYFMASVLSLYLTPDTDVDGLKTVKVPRIETLTVLDSEFRSATATITVPLAHAVCPTNTLLQAQPGSANAHVSEILTFQIIGGVAPYSFASSAPAIAKVVSSSGTAFNAQAVSAGTALLTVTSSDGQRANIAFTVY